MLGLLRQFTGLRCRSLRCRFIPCSPRSPQSIVLAATFAVSHNVPETKPLDPGPTRENLDESAVTRDWGVQQVLTSANWGGVIGNFFTGGLNLQVGGSGGGSEGRV